ncbi:hypothetical protein KIPB_014624, partial [Kipferlia bialata]
DWWRTECTSMAKSLHEMRKRLD